MTSNLKIQKSKIVLGVLLMLSSFIFAQKQTNKWKAQVAVGANHPFSDGFFDTYYAKPINFPTVNLGVQRMFKQNIGAKLDFSFSRFVNGDQVPDFKANYTRVNAQFVYDPTYSLNFLPQRMGVVAHAGPGISFVKPLGTLGNNKQTYLNAMLGAEIHFGISEQLSIYADTSYIYGFTSVEDYNPPISGLGAFNGSIMTVTVGITFSLSGCQYCD